MSALSEQMHEMICTLDGPTLAKIKADEELLVLWRDLGKIFVESCLRAIELGADPEEQELLMKLQEQLQTL